MSVLIKGMEMPKSCYVCPFCDYVSARCDAVKGNPYTQESRYEKRDDFCPLIEVPEPHGRMIDADALVEDLKRQCEEVFKIDAVSPDDFWITRDHAYNERLWKTWCESFFEYLKERDTVIPASEEQKQLVT